MKVYNPTNGRLDAIVESTFNPTLDPIVKRPEFDRLSILKEWLNDLFQSFLNAASGNTEPKISQKRDRAGNLYFDVYDPTSGASMSFGSEHEIRTWIEQRYHQ